MPLLSRSRVKRLFLSAVRYYNGVRVLGWSGVVIAAYSLVGLRREVRCHVNGIPVLVRTNTTDLDTLLQIFWREDYAFDVAVQPEIIVDGGANVGYASLYFAAKYADATIYALEPEPDNYRQLLRNVADFGRVVPINAAIWHENTTLSLHDAGAGAWGFRVRAETANDKTAVAAISVGSLLEQQAIHQIDILKLDVEGSEVEIFKHCQPWIDRVEAIVAELHDKYRNGCARAFYNATNDFPNELRLGENVVVSRSPLTSKYSSNGISEPKGPL